MKNLKISPEVHKALKVYCSERSLKISAFVDKLLLEYIKENSNGNKNV
jgi:hypothetical protein